MYFLSSSFSYAFNLHYLKSISEFCCCLMSILDVFCTCRELGIGIVAYSPLGRGFFAGKAVVETLPSQSLLVLS